MTSAPPVEAVAGESPGSVDDLAGSLRTEVSRLAYHLRVPATKSGITPTRLAALAALARHDHGCRQDEVWNHTHPAGRPRGACSSRPRVQAG